MKKIHNKIIDIIEQELPLINKKINGPILLEILKYKIIDNLKITKLIFNIENTVDSEIRCDDEFRKINGKLIYFNLKIINFNSIIKYNKLIIPLNEVINIDIESSNLKKIFNYKCIPMTGIILPEGSKCTFNYPKNTLILELSTFDKLLKVEKSVESII